MVQEFYYFRNYRHALYSGYLRKLQDYDDPALRLVFLRTLGCLLLRSCLLQSCCAAHLLLCSSVSGCRCWLRREPCPRPTLQSSRPSRIYRSPKTIATDVLQSFVRSKYLRSLYLCPNTAMGQGLRFSPTMLSKCGYCWNLDTWFSSS